MFIKSVFLEFLTSNNLVFSHKFELSHLYLSYKDFLFVTVCFVIKSIDHKLFFIVLRLVRGCGLKRDCRFVFVTLVGINERLVGSRVLEKTCRCCGTE